MKRLLKYIFGALAAVLIGFAVSWPFYMPSQAERGVWLHPGNGNIIDLGRITADMYNTTSIGCTKTASFPAHMGLVSLMEGASVQAQNGKLDLIVNTTIERQSFDPIESLPTSCSDPAEATPHLVFETMWAAMNENYAFFDLYGVDWDERHALSPEPNTELSDEELFEVMQKALTGLDDGHVQLLAGELGYFTPSVAPSWMPEVELSRETLTQIAIDTANAALKRSEFAPIDYGMRDDGIGYISIGGMWVDNGIGQSEISIAKEAFSQISEALKESKALIIDVRYNPGGSDGIPLTYAGFFIPDAVTVIKKRTKAGSSWVDPGEASISPAPASLQMEQPTIFLISDLTGSAAEIFTMAMREMPNVTVMGEPTGGGLSDIHGITLPNGWRFGLSNQEYRTNAGELFEAIGVPPDIAFEIDGDSLQDGEDTLLRAAIDHLNSL